jgi:hypothetical protein
MKRAIHSLVVVWSVLFSLSVFASPVVENANGDVKAGPSTKAATAVTAGQRVPPGSTVVTGAKSMVTLRFDDGQAVVLGENSEFKVTQYAFSKDQPKSDKFVFELLKGTMRSVSGLLTRRNPEAYSLRTPQATIGIRGTDFMVALVNPAFMRSRQVRQRRFPRRLRSRLPFRLLRFRRRWLPRSAN